ncbi:MAG: hypothetical protein PWR25_1263 [Euryarchaeota archaeon]|jgi:hypothetical protein|nr:hypothetical protein [Euryarchaeota archaeon]MDN5339374.1 hypothetical protein [Euryarchaeota archaeon]
MKDCTECACGRWARGMLPHDARMRAHETVSPEVEIAVVVDIDLNILADLSPAEPLGI